MNILIFGSGSSTIRYVEKHKEYFDTIKILAILDNDENKHGKILMEKEIISPLNILKYDYDAILICSVYEEEIYKQLIDKIKVKKNKIYTRISFMHKIIFNWYDKKYNLYNKKILILTENNYNNLKYKKYYERYYEILNISGIITIENINLIQNYEYDYIFITNFKPYTFQNEWYIKNINTIIKKINSKITKKHILLTEEVVNVYFNDIKEFTYGKKYPNKKFLVLRTRDYFSGLGGIALMVAGSVAYAKKKGYIPIIDMKTHETQYMEDGEYRRVNAYTKFFKQPSRYDLNDIKEAQSVSVMYMFYPGWYPKKWKNIFTIPKMQTKVYKEYLKFRKNLTNKRVLGVLFRGTDYANLKPYGHNIQPDLDSMLKTVKEKILEWGEFDLVYLCTEVQEACERFENEFGKQKICYYSQLRYKSDTNNYLGKVPLGIGGHTEQGKGYWIALNCLALCNSLIAGRCAGTDVALAINNNNYENLYLFNLGRYGMDNI